MKKEKRGMGMTSEIIIPEIKNYEAIELLKEFAFYNVDDSIREHLDRALKVQEFLNKTTITNKESDFKILKTEKRHADTGDYITPINLPNISPVCKVTTSYIEPRFLNSEKYIQEHEGTGYVDCVGSSGEHRLQYYEYEVITEWDGNIEYAFKNYSKKWFID